MLQLRKFYLYLFFISVGGVYAYTPVTWIDGTPNNLFLPPCVADPHNKFKKSSSWQGHVRANFFSVVEPKKYNYGAGFESYGLALQGHLHLDRLLSGLYGQLYIPTLLAHEKGYSSFWFDRSQETYSGYSATIADIPVLIGWEAVQKKRWHLAGYFVGTIPTAKHALFNHGLLQPLVSYNNQFSCGPGLESTVRLLGSAKHHIDWHLGADMTFWRGANKTWTVSTWSNGLTLEQVRVHASHMYRVKSDLSYKFKHFISDIGIQYLCIPEEKVSLIDQPLYTPIDISIDYSQKSWDLFLDAGIEMQIAKLPSYITIGMQSRADGSNFSGYCNVNLKIGTQF